MERLETLKKLTSAYLYFSTATSLIGTILAVLVTPANPYIAFPWYIAALMVLALSIAGLIRLRSKHVKDTYTFGVIAIQHSWWVLSVGFAGAMFYLADYFLRVAHYSSVIMFVFSVVWLIWGLYLVIALHKETKAPIAP